MRSLRKGRNDRPVTSKIVGRLRTVRRDGLRPASFIRPDNQAKSDQVSGGEKIGSKVK